MNKISVRHWDVVDDGQCLDFGTEIIVSSIKLRCDDLSLSETLEKVMNALEIDCEIECIDDAN